LTINLICDIVASVYNYVLSRFRQ